MTSTQTSDVDRNSESVPVHQSLIQPILLAGAHREPVILLWTVTAALCFPLRAWFLLPLAFLCHTGLTACARYDECFFPILFRALRVSPRYA